MKEVEPFANQGESCPKRLWVMTTLSDDEQLDESGELPQGLRFHLSRCPSCRALADRMLSVTTAIRELTGLEPADDLPRRADQQALRALREGGELTGRVEVSEIEDLEPADSRRPGRRVYLPYAAAAAVLLAAGAFWAAQFQARDGRLADGPVPEPKTLPVVQPTLAQTPPSGPSPSLVETPPEQRLAEERLARTDPAEPSTRPNRTVCDYHSHIEAAECEDDMCIHRAVILPDPAQRTLGWGGGFDNESPVESTEHLRNDK